MGQKCAKLSEKATRVCEGLVQTLDGLGNVHNRKMFGGYGIFFDQAMFALITSEGGVYFKVDESNRKSFEERGSKSYGRMPYFEVPIEIVTSEKDLRDWAKNSIAIALLAKAKKK